jgi:L,D-transpeptidase catalytic domain.
LNVVEENKRIALVYSQKDGTLLDMEDRLVGKGYSGAPGNVNDPTSQGKKNLGVIPQGTWEIGEVTWNKDDTHGKGENLIHLKPDTATAERVQAMGRDPNTFYIHAGKKDPNDRSASQGCIIIPEKEDRKALRELQGAKIRVVR